MSMPVDNWLADTLHLTLAEYAILHKLHCHAWRRNGLLPTETAVIARMLGVGAEELRAVLPAIQPWLGKSADGQFITIPELELERVRAFNVREQKRRGAALGNASPKRKRSDSDPDSDPQSGTHSGTDSAPGAGHPPPPPPPPTSQTPHPNTQEGERGNQTRQTVTSRKSTTAANEYAQSNAAEVAVTTLNEKIAILCKAQPDWDDSAIAKVLRTDVDSVRAVQASPKRAKPAQKTARAAA